MPVNTTYSGYDAAIEKITLVKDFAGGDFAVKEKGETYLPKLDSQTAAQYSAYKGRGYVIPAVAPTASAIAGSIMRRDPTMDDSQLDYLWRDADGAGTGLGRLLTSFIDELLKAGGFGCLIEHNGLNAVIKFYTKENIINITSDFIVLKQYYSERDDRDKFETIEKVEYLELTIDDNGKYIQNIWRQTNKTWSIYKTLDPKKRGERLDFIPFVLSKDFHQDPILLNLATVNLDQYKLSTDLRHGLHWVALPTMFVFGELRDDKGNSKSIKIGAGSFNHIEDPEARAELLEFTGAGIKSIKDAIDDDINTMAAIGAKLLSNDNGGVRAAETARIESASETATLATIANNIDDTFSEVLEVIATWQGVNAPDFAINRDFIDIKLDHQTLMALLKTWQSGGMSLDTFLTNLEKGELLPKGISAEDEAARIGNAGADFNE